MSSEYDNIPTLTSVGSYIRLDTEFVSQDNHEKCSEYNKVSSEHSKLYDLCLSLTGNLMNYEKLDFFQELNSYKCNYLNLWTYYQLYKFDEKEYPNIRALVVKHWNESGKYDLCNNTDFVLYLARDADYIKSKRLYDYALNYYKLKEYYYDNDAVCNSKEEEYIRKSNQLYEDIKAKCADNSYKYNSYCKAYNVVKEIHPNDRLLELKCKKVEHGNETSRVDGIGLSGDHVGHGSQEDTETSSYGSHSTSGSHNAIGTAVPILGVLSIGFILHKFTGLGSMARNFLRGRINGMNSHDELPNELLESTYDDQVHPGITETYIGYQAT
ncbi:PIR Superfamily Protein [Plasmodium ovale curtisi]|uniref:PIR Superfamily Protein n=1 Tax=Plasmodium ovale curtisi TaxID=864141 RepID=A0A1A8WMZ6_PLAOA|nr:PIR Superfamily Protein [Plasmodium ovale curtisi]SBS99397.1 PIR Superfamily Protein [Plasmodium ovale curtisi]